MGSAAVIELPQARGNCDRIVSGFPRFAPRGGNAAAKRAFLVDGGGEWRTVERSGGKSLGEPRGRWPVFFGTYTPRLDDKGRLFLPAKFRDELSEGLVVTRGQERCLSVWPLQEFGKLTERMKEAPVTNKGARDYVRMLFAGASDETPDKQGRITIPPMLREYAALTRDCIVIGAMNRIEIWDAASWQTYSEQQEQAFADLSEEVFPGVI
jgi:MraZ protein